MAVVLNSNAVVASSILIDRSIVITCPLNAAADQIDFLLSVTVFPKKAISDIDWSLKNQGKSTTARYSFSSVVKLQAKIANMIF
jgi:hypothetical protein